MDPRKKEIGRDEIGMARPPRCANAGAREIVAHAGIRPAADARQELVAGVARDRIGSICAHVYPEGRFRPRNT